jgi:hypothetical protein
LGSTGCNLLKQEEKPAPGASAANEVGRPLQDIELPVSLRISDPAPRDARQVEATDEQLRLDGDPVVALERGRVPAADKSGDIIPKLEAKLRSPVRSTLAIRLQANLPYETLALVVSTARKVGMSNAAFQVREIGEGRKTGWLAFDSYLTSSKAEDLPAFAVPAKTWNAFTDKWQPAFDGCRTAPNGNCAYVNDNVAEGGTLRMELFASGRGININFFRRGLTQAQEVEEDKMRAKILAKKKEDFLQGRITHDDMVEALLLGDPSTYALFQFRYQEALKRPSAITKTMAPMCHGEKCALVITADSVTATLNVLSLVGAAFPDGTPMPQVSFELPWTERPKPAVLSEWIETQSKL